MDDDLKPGLHISKKYLITEQDLASTLKTGDVPFAATPALIIMMEKIICDKIHHLIPSNNTSVSAEINIKHLLPLSVNDEVTCSVHLKFVEDNKLFFDFAVFNVNEDIAAIGAHERIIVDKNEYLKQ